MDELSPVLQYVIGGDFHGRGLGREVGVGIGIEIEVGDRG